MTRTPNQLQSANTINQRRFLITLNADASGDYQIRSCELTGAHFRNRTSFKTGTTLEEVFCFEFVNALRCHFQKLRNLTEVLSLPTFLFEIPGLTLSGMDIMATKLNATGTNIIVRFKAFLGGINRIFNQRIGFDDAVRDPTVDLAAQVICDVALPLLDICSSAELGIVQPAKQLSDFDRRICERSHEIRFQAELLKRFVTYQARKETRHESRELLSNLTDYSETETMLKPTY